VLSISSHNKIKIEKMFSSSIRTRKEMLFVATKRIPTDPPPGLCAAIYANPTSGNKPIPFSGIARRVL
jgi:hypothetical protein